ncbi:hypothetical protein [Undibacterium sp. TJN19]|uniref:hypothetical protein n=1 Tax=Undibacterium sp. TJN19 TaxID=3413055 RepID=UPI003BF1CA79
MRIKSFLISVLLWTLSNSVFAAELLAVADVEKVTGLSGIQVVGKDPAKGAGGELNFANADKKLITMVMIQDGSMFDFWKKQYGKDGVSIQGVGTEAFHTKPDSAISYIAFKKGNKAIWIQSMGWNKTGKPNLTDAQLAELAKLAASRM